MKIPKNGEEEEVREFSLGKGERVLTLVRRESFGLYLWV
jgi:hypothetical protein